MGVAIPAFLIALFPALKRRMFSVMLVASAAPSMLYPQLADQLLKWSEEGGDQAFGVVLATPFAVTGAVLVLGGCCSGFVGRVRSGPSWNRPAGSAWAIC